MKKENLYITIMRFIFRLLCPGYHLAANPPKGKKKRGRAIPYPREEGEYPKSGE
jgi:hypothetical protein